MSEPQAGISVPVGLSVQADAEVIHLNVETDDENQDQK